MPDNNDSSWYARKLAAMRGLQPRPFQGQQQPAPQYQQQQPVARYQQNPQQAPQPAPLTGRPETMSELLSLQEHGQVTGPGKGGKLNPDPCPNCGGALFYADLGLKRRGPPPAPHCFTCGYNELFEQGLESTWQGGA